MLTYLRQCQTEVWEAKPTMCCCCSGVRGEGRHAEQEDGAQGGRARHLSSSTRPAPWRSTACPPPRAPSCACSPSRTSRATRSASSLLRRQGRGAAATEQEYLDGEEAARLAAVRRRLAARARALARRAQRPERAVAGRHGAGDGRVHHGRPCECVARQIE